MAAARGKKAKKSSSKRLRRISRGLALGQEHVRLEPPAGPPLEAERLAVSLRGLAIRELVSDDEPAGGPLFFELEGQRSTLAWRRHANGEVSLGGVPQLLYVGRPRASLAVSVELVESDAELRGRLDRLARVFDSLAGAAGAVPGQGTAAGAGLSLAAALARQLRAAFADLVELRFVGSLELEAVEGAAVAGVPLRQGDYRLTRPRADGKGDAVEIRLRVEPFEASAIDPRREVVVVLDRVDLELRDVQEDDTLRLAFAFEGGARPGTRTRTRAELELALELEKRGVWAERRLGVHGAPLYRGPWGEGLAFSISAAALPRKLSAELSPLIERAAALTAAVAPREQDDADAVAGVAEGLRETALALIPERRFSATKTGAIRAGAGTEAAEGPVYAVELGPRWQPLPVEIELAGHGVARLTLQLRAVD